MLYIRMILYVIVSLYTSRVVLQTLGVSDYGIYSLVGGIVVLFTFLNTSMSGATSRFLTYELGKGDKERLTQTFSSALIVHIGIALFVFLLAETIGLWLLSYKLVIPEDRIFAAHVVYQCSILSTMIQMTQVPYNASIISHEKMDVYAYIELLNVFLRLGIVYLLVIGNFDKLILYSILVLTVSMTIASIYRIYCIKQFKECRFHFIWKKDILKPLLSFSVWDLYGNMSVSLRQQGLNILVNMFFGTIYNASCGIAAKVQGIISGFSINIMQAFRPQIIKKYAVGDFDGMQTMMGNAVKCSILMLLFISLPLWIELKYVMQLWLVQVPIYTVEFCRILLANNFLAAINVVLTIAIHATGNIKRISFWVGSTYLASLPAIYMFYKYVSSDPSISYYILFLTTFVAICIEFKIIKKQIPEMQLYIFFRQIVKTLFVGFISALPLIMIVPYMNEGIWRLCVVYLVYGIIISSFTYLFLLDKETKRYIKNKIKNEIIYYNSKLE